MSFVLGFIIFWGFGYREGLFEVFRGWGGGVNDLGGRFYVGE